MPSLNSVMLPVKDADTVGSGDNRYWLQHWQDVKLFPTRHLDSAQLSLQQVTIPCFVGRQAVHLLVQASSVWPETTTVSCRRTSISV